MAPGAHTGSPLVHPGAFAAGHGLPASLWVGQGCSRDHAGEVSGSRSARSTAGPGPEAWAGRALTRALAPTCALCTWPLWHHWPPGSWWRLPWPLNLLTRHTRQLQLENSARKATEKPVSDHGPGPLWPLLRNTTGHGSRCEWLRGGVWVVPDSCLPAVHPRSLQPPSGCPDLSLGRNGPRSGVRSMRVSGSTRVQGSMRDRNDLSSSMHTLSPHAQTATWIPCSVRGNAHLSPKLPVPVGNEPPTLSTAPPASPAIFSTYTSCGGP
jgi:hypothetical protein